MGMPFSMDALTHELFHLLKLEKIDNYLFKAPSLPLFGSRIFGGQLLAQTIIASSSTCNKPAHSLHAYFLKAGDADSTVLYEVQQLRKSPAFYTAQIRAFQHGEIIFSAFISHCDPEDAPDYQQAEPEAVTPEALKTEEEWKAEYADQVPEAYRKTFLTPFNIEIRPVSTAGFVILPHAVTGHIEYLKTLENIPPEFNQTMFHQAIVAYMSDYELLTAALKPHAMSYLSPGLISASLDHSLYFHRPVAADQWLKYSIESTISSNARGMNSGQFWQNGLLVCSCTQESLMRIAITNKS